jgi:hypothetical protein
MSIWGYGSPASYCQPSAAADFVYLEFSWLHAPFVFSSVWLYPPFAIAVFFLFRIRVGRWPSPLSCGVCHTLATIGSLPLSKCTGGGGATPAFWQFHEGVPFPHSPELRVPLPSLLSVFFFFFFFQLLVYYLVCFFLFFPWVGFSLSRWLCWFSPGLCVGEPRAAKLIWLSASPKQVRSWRLAVWAPSWFLHWIWSKDAMCGLGCGGVGVFPLLGGFSCKVYLQRLSMILLSEARFLLPPCSRHLRISCFLIVYRNRIVR